jgi:photosystem II stability/assembly factor-like uncharacterized protein
MIASTAEAQPNKLITRGMGGGGALFHPSIAPSPYTEVYVASDMSGVYRSGNSGATWSLLDFRQIQGSGAYGHVQFTNSWSVLYSISYIDEIPKPVMSSDGGFTWHAITDPTSGDARTLLVDVEHPNTMVLASSTAIYFSADGGQNWAQRYTDATGHGCHVAGAYFAPPNIAVGTNGGLLLSTNSGQSFALNTLTGVPSTEAMVSFAGGSSNGVTRYVCVTMDANKIYTGIDGADHGSYKNVYTLTSGTASWTQRSALLPADVHPFYAAMASNNADIMYIAGGSTQGVPTVYRTTDGGASWGSSFQTTNNQNIATGWSGYNGDRDWTYGEYVLGLAVSPNNASAAAITDLGFIHMTNDAGISWRQSYLAAPSQNVQGSATPKSRYYRSNGMENTSCWSLFWNSATSVIGCYSDIRATYSSDGGVSWSQNSVGNTLNTLYNVVKHSTTGTIYASASSVHDLYESTYLTDARIDGGQGRVLYSTNGGANWQTLHDFYRPVVWVALDPLNNNRMYVSVVSSVDGGIYACSDITQGPSSTWTLLPAPPRTEGHPFNIVILNDGTLVSTWSGRRANNAFTPSSGVFISTTGGSTWIDRSANPGMYYWTKDITMDQSDPNQNTWYVGVYSGWGNASAGQGGLYRTTDRGVSWTRYAISDRVNSCSFHPARTPELFVTTESDGLLYCYNINATPPVFISNLAYPFKHPTRVVFNPFGNNEIWITSFGYGCMQGSAVPVPVELEMFRAVMENGRAVLRWTTTTETNNAGFRIQRMEPGSVKWSDQGFVQGANTTMDSRSYEYFDPLPLAPGRTAYRLVQTDLDGTTEYSQVDYIDLAVPSASSIASIYPSPATGRTYILASLRNAGHVTIELWDCLGRKCATIIDADVTAGMQPLPFDAAQLRPGTYHLRMITGDGITARAVQIGHAR